MTYGICLSLSDLFRFVWWSLGPSMLLQMALFHSFFYGWSMHCVCVCVCVCVHHTPHFLYPFTVNGHFHVLAIVSTAAVKKLVFQIQGQRFGLRFRVRVPTQWGNGDPRKSNAVLSCFSHVWLFSTPWTVTHQAPLAMGFPRQEYWGGLPFPPPGDLPNPGIEPTSPALAGSSWL